MLVQLVIRHYATIEHLDLDLRPGMTVITGETGAGKSIMVDALGLALGDRADSSAVRPGAERAEILAHFSLDDLPEARQWLQERDLDQEDVCLLRRIVTTEGRSRAYINGSLCSLNDLKTLGAYLVDIHSQHEHQSLLRAETHRRLLDEYAQAQSLAQQVQQLAQHWSQTRRALEQHQQQQAQRQAQQELLEYQHEELEQLGLVENEVPQLEQEHRQLAEAEALLSNCRYVLDLCSEGKSGTIQAALNSSLNRLTGCNSRPKALEEAIQLLSSAQIQVAEAVNELQHFIDHFNSDPQHQQQLEQRLNTLYRLARKHRIQPEALLEHQQQLHHTLTQLQEESAHCGHLEQHMDQLAQEYRQQAEHLSHIRRQAATQLEAIISREIQGLGMPKGRFKIELEPQSTTIPQPHGLEQINFLVSANPGQPVRPLAKVASGGELSRISLAIQVITAQTSGIPTLIFDEVDVGIGGPTAAVIGQLLRQLGNRGQVLSVTHAAQVAAHGHQHLLVHKADDGQETHTQISELSSTQRVEELARMMSGLQRTEESYAHARALLEDAVGQSGD